MKIKVIIPNVHTFRKIYESKDGNAMYSATCPILSIHAAREQLDKVLGINPRYQKLTSVPSKSMQETLRDEQDTFVFRNRGLTLVAGNAMWDNKTEDLEIEFEISGSANEEINGLADGGHTYNVIKDFVDQVVESEQKEITAEIRLDLITGFADQQEDIIPLVEARNTSTQVRLESIMNMKGMFNDVKDVLEGESYAGKIAYHENELIDKDNPDAGLRSIKISSLLSYLLCFDPTLFNENQHPTVAYSSKKKVLDMFAERYRTDKEDVVALIRLLPQIVELRDHIESSLPDVWNKVSGRFANQKGVRALKRERMLDFSDDKVKYDVPSGFIYPLLSANRALLVKSKGKYGFRQDPRELYDKMNAEEGRSLVYKLINVSDKDPQAMGKNPELYDACYGTLRGFYYESVNN